MPVRPFTPIPIRRLSIHPSSTVGDPCCPAPQKPGKPKPKKKPPAKKAKPKKAKPRKAPAKPRPGAGRISPQCRTLLIDRLEDAIVEGRIDLHDDYEDCGELCITGGEYALLLRILLPEEYADPHAGRGLPRATATAPGSADRIAEYAGRVADRRVIALPEDATAHKAHDRGLRIEQRKNGSGVKVVGWAED